MNRLYNPRLQAVSGKVTLWTYLKWVKCELKTSRCYNSEIFTIRLIILELFWDVPKYYWLSFLLTPESELTFLLRVLKIICKDIPTERTGNCFLSFGKSLFCVFLSLNVLRVCVSFNRNAILLRFLEMTMFEDGMPTWLGVITSTPQIALWKRRPGGWILNEPLNSLTFEPMKRCSLTGIQEKNGGFGFAGISFFTSVLSSTS